MGKVSVTVGGDPKTTAMVTFPDVRYKVRAAACLPAPHMPAFLRAQGRKQMLHKCVCVCVRARSSGLGHVALTHAECYCLSPTVPGPVQPKHAWVAVRLLRLAPHTFKGQITLRQMQSCPCLQGSAVHVIDKVLLPAGFMLPTSK